jgi:hypothetical protein
MTVGCGASRHRPPASAQGADAAYVPDASGQATMTSAPTARPPRFEGHVSRIGSTLRRELIGRNWHPGCPVRIEDLRHVHLSYWDFDGNVREGPLVVHEDVAADALWVFRRMFRAGFPIHRIALPPRYRPPRPEDRLSTRSLTSAFNCRPATDSPGSLSHHSYGWAIDINPLQNPYVRSDGSVLRRAVKPYLDRTLRRQGMIHAGDIVVRSFARIGWTWGGNWRTLKDYMHFSLTGR